MLHRSSAYRRAKTREDLLGSVAISYWRFSAVNQGSGSTLDRQEAVCESLIDWFQLRIDPRWENFIDKGRSAWKGYHRKRGKLGVLLKLCGLDPDGNRLKDKDGKFLLSAFDKGTVLLIEAIDRLVREGMSISYHLIGQLIRVGGLVILTGDEDIWDEVSIDKNGDRLARIIQRAYDEATRMGQKQLGAREQMRKDLAAWKPGMPKPVVKPPGWLTRIGSKKEKTTDYEENDHADTVRHIYVLCAEGTPIRQIVLKLNRETGKYPMFGDHGRKKWSHPRVYDLLHNERVLGIATSRESGTLEGVEEHWKDRKAVAKAAIFPQIISDRLWRDTRAALSGRRILRGRHGVDVGNLFVKQVFCHCNKRMYFKSPHNAFQCHGYHEQGETVCADKTLHSAQYYEGPILTALATLSEKLVPPSQDETLRRLAEQLAAAQNAIMRKQASRADLLAAMEREVNPKQRQETAQDVVRLGGEVSNLRDEEDRLKREMAVASEPVNHKRDVETFLRTHRKHALQGEKTARLALRDALAQIDYRITSRKQGGLTVTLGGSAISIPPPKFPLYLRIRRHNHPELPKRGEKRKINGKMMTYNGGGWWTDGRTVVRIRLKGEMENANQHGNTKRGTKRLIDGVPMYYSGMGWWSAFPPDMASPSWTQGNQRTAKKKREQRKADPTFEARLSTNRSEAAKARWRKWREKKGPKVLHPPRITGHKGVIWDRARGRFMVRVGKKSARFLLLEDAVAAHKSGLKDKRKTRLGRPPNTPNR